MLLARLPEADRKRFLHSFFPDVLLNYFRLKGASRTVPSGRPKRSAKLLVAKRTAEFIDQHI